MDSPWSDCTNKREDADSNESNISNSKFLQGDEPESGWSSYNTGMSGYCLSGAWCTEDSGPGGKELEDKRGGYYIRHAI